MGGKDKWLLMKEVRERKKAKGLVKIEVWVKAEDKQKVKDFEKQLNSN